MDKEKKEQYSFKVTQANRTQLVVILYDIILDDLTTAQEVYSKDSLDEFTSILKHGQKFLIELMKTLDCQYAISMELMTLYLYINKKMIQAIVQRKPDALVGLDEVIGKLRYAYDVISRTDYSGPVMKNTEQVYAGLTYHKGNLTESYLDAQNQLKRGFTV